MDCLESKNSTKDHNYNINNILDRSTMFTARRVITFVILLVLIFSFGYYKDTGGNTTFYWIQQHSTSFLSSSSSSSNNKSFLRNKNTKTSTATTNTVTPFFAVLGSNRTGVNWLLSEINTINDNSVCLPIDNSILDPVFDSIDYLYPNLPIECTYTYLRESLENVTRHECIDIIENDNENEENDNEQENLICHWLINILPVHYDPFDDTELLFNKYVEALQSHDINLIPNNNNNQCYQQQKSCNNNDKSAMGVRIASEWLPRVPVEPWNPPDINPLGISKIIYVQRTNYLARYMSKLRYDYKDSSTLFDINTQDMLNELYWMQIHDESAERFIKQYEEQQNNKKKNDNQILRINYEQCRQNMNQCIKTINEYVGIEHTSSSIIEQQRSFISDQDGLYDSIINPAEVQEALRSNGYDDYYYKSVDNNTDENEYQPIELVLYESNDSIARNRQFNGVHSTLIYGQTKWKSVIDYMQTLPSDRIVVVGDMNRNVQINYLYGPLATFKTYLNKKTGIVLASVSKYPTTNNHFQSGSLIQEDGTRTDLMAIPENSIDATEDETNIYLDSGLLAGRVSDLLHILQLVNIGDNEDATAILSDLMYQKPNLLQLDIDGSLFGYFRNSPIHDDDDDGCNNDNNADEKFISLLDPLVLQRRPCLNTEPEIIEFPVWDTEEGVPLQPVLDHITRVCESKGKLSGVDTSFGLEVPYIVSNDRQLLASNTIRNHTSPGIIKYRTGPMEGTGIRALELIGQDDNAEIKWPAITKAIRNGGFPFFGWYGDFKKCNVCNYDDSDSIPIFTTSATVGCNYAFPVPSYQQIFDARTDRYRYLFNLYNDTYPFESKIRKVVWRGTLSDNNVAKIYDSIRWRLVEKVYKSGHEMFDVGLTKIPKHNHRVEANLTEVGGLVDYISPMENMQNYLAILDMDGNSWSSRFGILLCYNSVVIKVEPHYVDYFYQDLQPWTHYIPVKDDLTDLFESVEFVMDPKNSNMMKDIIASANQWCAERFTPDHLAYDLADIMESYVRLLDRADPNWSDTWNDQKDKLLESPLYDFIAL